MTDRRELGESVETNRLPRCVHAHPRITRANCSASNKCARAKAPIAPAYRPRNALRFKGNTE